MTEKPGGSVGRIFEVIDLILAELPLIRAEDVIKRLGYSKSASYRDLKRPCDVGLLAQAGGGLWSLGPRIVELERLMYRTASVLQAGQRHMADLAPPHPATNWMFGIPSMWKLEGPREEIHAVDPPCAFRPLLGGRSAC